MVENWAPSLCKGKLTPGKERERSNPCNRATSRRSLLRRFASQRSFLLQAGRGKDLLSRVNAEWQKPRVRLPLLHAPSLRWEERSRRMRTESPARSFPTCGVPPFLPSVTHTTLLALRTSPKTVSSSYDRRFIVLRPLLCSVLKRHRAEFHLRGFPLPSPPVLGFAHGAFTPSYLPALPSSAAFNA